MTTVLDEILSWSAARPAWQRDALRRFLLDGEVDNETIRSYADSAMGVAGPTLQPLSTEHLATGGLTHGQVNVTAVRKTKHVNRLTEDQTLTFRESGLTVVYGDNGSGKSGYARVLKSVTRTRATATVRNDIFDDRSHVPSAVIDYSVDGNAQPPFAWAPDTESPSELTYVSFFDRFCAQVYLSRDTEAAFRPFGLDLFDSLYALCGKVRAELDRRVSEARKRTVGLPELDDTTEAGRFLLVLRSTTSDEEIAAAVAFSEQDRERAKELNETLAAVRSGGAAAEAERLTRLANRAEATSASLSEVAAAFSVESHADLISLHDSAINTAIAAEAARHGSMADSYLSGVGEGAWRALWEAARQYSTVVYPGREYPVVEDAQCLLCQQPIGGEAARRLQAFEGFIKDTTQSAADVGAAARDERIATLREIEVAGQSVAQLVEDLRPEAPEAADAIELFGRSAQAARSAFLAIVADATAEPISEFPESPASVVDLAVVALREQASTLRAATTEGGSEVLVAELTELGARESLAKAKELLLVERDRLKHIATIENAKSATTTNSISQKAADLTAKVLTDVLVNRFARETERLGLDNVQLTTVGGRQGVLRYKAGFLGARQEAPLPEVLSEGEQSALGLAGFLTELWTDDSKSAAVFDDPVSSLDHGRRDKVAERLVLLAQERPTIIFTHDVAFIIALKKHADHYGVPLLERSIERVNGKPGRCLEYNKFSTKLVKERLDELKAEIARLKEMRGSIGDEEYRDLVSAWYKRLRQTWERAIEETLVGEILTRHDLQVHPRMARTLVLFTVEDNRDLQYGYGRATEGGESHDESEVINSPPPDLADLEKDLELLTAWHKRIADRRNLSEEKIYERAEAASPPP